MTDPYKDPLERLQSLLSRAAMTHRTMPTAMALATATPDGKPSVRMVLLRGLDARGIVFYTNHRSRKGVELKKNPRASVCFWWDDLQEQVRVEGRVVKVEAAEADEYFAGRPRVSQLGAWASDQSKHLPNPAVLEKKLHQLEQKYEGLPVPRPPYWSGYRLVPDAVEFWVERPFRLHERMLYTRTADGWTSCYLYP